jgi:hypothetical protein
MPGNFSLYVIAIFVSLPSTLAAAFWTLLGTDFVLDAFRRHDRVMTATALLAALVTGWFGLVTLWRLHYRLLQGRADFNQHVAWAGLACGCLVSLGLIAVTGGTLIFRIIFFGWPLLAAAYFAFVLWRLPPTSRHVSPTPR